jgi:hypothetical protein
MLQNVLGDLQEDDVVLEVLLFQFVGADAQDDEA